MASPPLPPSPPLPNLPAFPALPPFPPVARWCPSRSHGCRRRRRRRHCRRPAARQPFPPAKPVPKKCPSPPSPPSPKILTSAVAALGEDANAAIAAVSDQQAAVAALLTRPTVGASPISNPPFCPAAHRYRSAVDRDDQTEECPVRREQPETRWAARHIRCDGGSDLLSARFVGSPPPPGDDVERDRVGGAKGYFQSERNSSSSRLFALAGVFMIRSTPASWVLLAVPPAFVLALALAVSVLRQEQGKEAEKSPLVAGSGAVLRDEGPAGPGRELLQVPRRARSRKAACGSTRCAAMLDGRRQRAGRRARRAREEPAHQGDQPRRTTS